MALYPTHSILRNDRLWFAYLVTRMWSRHDLILCTTGREKLPKKFGTRQFTQPWYFIWDAKDLLKAPWTLVSLAHCTYLILFKSITNAPILQARRCTNWEQKCAHVRSDMVYCGIWDKYIVGFMRMVNSEIHTIIWSNQKRRHDIQLTRNDTKHDAHVVHMSVEHREYEPGTRNEASYNAHRTTAETVNHHAAYGSWKYLQ